MLRRARDTFSKAYRSSLVGGALGARIAKTVPNEVARKMLVVVGAILTAAFAWRYWF